MSLLNSVFGEEYKYNLRDVANIVCGHHILIQPSPNGSILEPPKPSAAQDILNLHGIESRFLVKHIRTNESVAQTARGTYPLITGMFECYFAPTTSFPKGAMLLTSGESRATFVDCDIISRYKTRVHVPF